MNRFACLCPFLFFYLVVLVVPSNSGEYETIDDGKSVLIEDPTPIISPYADFRLRYETDWDSARANGSLRDDRMRARIRARLGAKIEPTENLTFNIRARTGNSDSQQSPHLTIQDFNGGERDDFDGILDLYYGQYEGDSFTIWFGRNQFPFWRQNELFWDDDVTITGSSLSVGSSADGNVEFITGAFYLPDGGWDLNGQLYAGQAVYRNSFGDLKLTAGTGIYALRGRDGAENLRNGNGARDYTILGNEIQIQRKVFGMPFQLGADAYINLENYSSASDDPFTARNFDEDFGYVLSATVQPGKLTAGYYYSYLETLAVNASYAEDDFVRWGSDGQTDSSDLRGHEIRLGYQATKKLNILGRLYLVDAITSEQDGMRFRVDFNYRF